MKNIKLVKVVKINGAVMLIGLLIGGSLFIAGCNKPNNNVYISNQITQSVEEPAMISLEDIAQDDSVDVVEIQPEEVVEEISEATEKSFLLGGKDMAFVRVIDGKVYSPEELYISGYEDFDYAQAISFILTRAQSSQHGIDGMQLNGITLKEHILNLCKVAYLEDVNPNIMLSQQLLETGYYGFVNSMVKPTDNNYCGLGALDGGNSANSFATNKEGQLAQAQHLKAYSNTEPLNAETKDVRFKFINRGVAPTVAGLAGTWASDREYAEKIATIYSELLNHETNEELIKEHIDKIF